MNEGQFLVKFYDGIIPEGQNVVISLLEPTQLEFLDTGQIQPLDPFLLRIDEDFGGKRRVYLNDTQYFLTDHLFLEKLNQIAPQETHYYRLLIEKLERHWGLALGSFLVVLIFGGVFTIKGIPYIAHKIALAIPNSTAKIIGNQSILNLERLTLVEKSTLPVNVQERIKSQYLKLCKQTISPEQCEIHFKKSKHEALNVNAFAVPGGAIVLMDGLYDLAKNDQEVLSILAHELGHQVHTHALRGLVEGAIFTISYTFMLGDLSSLSDILSSAPALLFQTKFSRNHETEADDTGLDILIKNDISPIHFANMMEKITGKFKTEDQNSEDTNYENLISTHPDTESRIAKARAKGLLFAESH